MGLLLSFVYSCCCCLLLTSGLGVIRAFQPTKLFVFGDSYADTGNYRKSFMFCSPWNSPYGFTFPGKPAGRFSDGRILTDYLAKFMGLKSPLAYEWMRLGGTKLRNGLNFAYGGSGVFDTFGDLFPNMTTQIGFLEKLMHRSKYTKRDLQSSVVLVCLSGNDYGAFVLNDDTHQGLVNFIPLVINQLTRNLNRTNRLGATRIVVTTLQPLGCLPRSTETSSFQQCNTTRNKLANYHNRLLQQAVAKLNNGTKSSTFFVLDLYSSFTTVLQQKGSSQGDLKFETPLKPCCTGINSGYSCGSVDENGKKMYTVCRDPKSSFFWDSSHPMEAGWSAVYAALKSSLEKILKFY